MTDHDRSGFNVHALLCFQQRLGYGCGAVSLAGVVASHDLTICYAEIGLGMKVHSGSTISHTYTSFNAMLMVCMQCFHSCNTHVCTWYCLAACSAIWVSSKPVLNAIVDTSNHVLCLLHFLMF